MEKHQRRNCLGCCLLVLAVVTGGIRTAHGRILVTGPAADTSGGTDPNSPVAVVNVYEQTIGNLPTARSFLPYKDFLRGVDVATTDSNGDGTPDIITAPASSGSGPLDGSEVRIFDGITHNQIGGFYPYGEVFKGRVNVAAGQANGRSIIATGVNLNGTPQFRIFDGKDHSLLRTFSNLGHLFPNGSDVNLSMRDFNNDGLDDVVASGGGWIALIKTALDNRNRLSWNTINPPTLIPFPGYTGRVETSISYHASASPGQVVPTLLAGGLGNVGINAYNISNLNSPQQIGNNVKVGNNLTGLSIASGFSENELGGVVVSPDTPGAVPVTVYSDHNLAASTLFILPYSGGTGAHVAVGSSPNILSRAFTVTPDRVSTGLGDPSDGAFKNVNLFGEIEANIFATGPDAVGKNFDVHSLNLNAIDPTKIHLPNGIRLLPNTRALFATTDAPEGSYEAELMFFFTEERFEAILKALGAVPDDLRWGHITKGSGTDVEWTITVTDTPDGPIVRQYTDDLGEPFVAITDTQALASFSGYALVVIPEPTSLVLLGIGGLALLLRRKKSARR